MNGADDFEEIDGEDCLECGAGSDEMHTPECSQFEDDADDCDPEITKDEEDHKDERDLSIPRPGQ